VEVHGALQAVVELAQVGEQLLLLLDSLLSLLGLAASRARAPAIGFVLL